MDLEIPNPQRQLSGSSAGWQLHDADLRPMDDLCTGGPRARKGPPPGEYGWLIGVPGGPGTGLGAVITSVDMVEARLGGHQFRCPSVSPRPALNVAELQPVGVLRHQPVARLVVRFLGVERDGSIVVRTRVRVRIDFLADSSPVTHRSRWSNARPETGPFALVLGVLLNADHLPKPWDETTHDDPTPTLTDEHGLANTASKWFADPDTLKLVTASDGPVQVSGTQLAAAGWDLASLNPRSVSVSRGDRVVAAIVIGSDDGRLDPGDAILFEGRSAQGVYTRENVYWLTRSGPGKRATTHDAAPGAAMDAKAFRASKHIEEDTSYLVSLRASDTTDRWLWGSGLSAQSPLFAATIAVPDLSATAGPAGLRVQLLGYAHDPSVSPDHRMRLSVNGVFVEDAAFDGVGLHVVEATLAPGLLTTGRNLIEVRSVGSGAAHDTVFVDWIEVAYEAGYVAVDSYAAVGVPGPGTYTFQIDGFPRPDITTLDITNPDQLVELRNAAVVAVDGGYSVRFTMPVTTGTRLSAFTPDAAAAPIRIEANAPSGWSNSEVGADFVVITHPEFARAIEPLISRHRSDGMRVATVLIDDVYDEFSAGVFHPPAIRSFLRHAFLNWQPPAPTYVLLVGEANLDYRRAYDSGPRNFVPSVQFDTTSGLTGEMGAATSDSWYAAVAGDDVLPDMILGRISVSTATQAQTVVDKTLRVMDTPGDQAWQRNIVLVADDDGAEVFEPFSEEIASTLPATGTAQRFYAGSYPNDSDIAADIGGAIEQGALAINFTGHGNVSLWSPWPGGGRIFENADIERLRNDGRMPLFTSATCMNGWFDHPFVAVSMAEMWLRHPAGGGVVAWTPSGMAAMSAQRVLLPSVYRGMFDERRAPIGVLTAEAIARAAAQSADWNDVIQMFVLFGDPALVISGAPETDDRRIYLPAVRVEGNR